MQHKKPAVGKKANTKSGAKNAEAKGALVLLKQGMAKGELKSGIVLFGPDVLLEGKPGAFLATNRKWEIAIFYPIEEEGTAHQIRHAIGELMGHRFRDVKQRLEDTEAEHFRSRIFSGQIFRSAMAVREY